MTVPDGGITVAIIVGIGSHLLKALEQVEGVAIDRRTLASRHSGGQGREDGKKGLGGKHFAVSSRTEENDRDMDNYDSIPVGNVQALYAGIESLTATTLSQECLNTSFRFGRSANRELLS